MLWIIITALIVAADQVAKYVVSATMRVGDVALSLGLFDITYIKNEGAAFSILSGRMSLLSVISIVFCLAVIVWWIKKKPTNKLMCLSVSMMFAGALSNAVDRIFRGFVVDYIHTTFMNFPVFNIADIAITLGAALLILYEIIFDKEAKNGKADNKSE